MGKKFFSVDQKSARTGFFSENDQKVNQKVSQPWQTLQFWRALVEIRPNPLSFCPLDDYGAKQRLFLLNIHITYIHTHDSSLRDMKIWLPWLSKGGRVGRKRNTHKRVATTSCSRPWRTLSTWQAVVMSSSF